MTEQMEIENIKTVVEGIWDRLLSCAEGSRNYAWRMYRVHDAKRNCEHILAVGAAQSGDPLACPEQLRAAAQAFGRTVAELPPKWKELVGVAGLVAEEMLRSGTDDVDEIIDALLSVISEGAASASDLEMMGITDIVNGELSYEVVEEAVRILRDLWQIVREEAQYLIESCAG